MDSETRYKGMLKQPGWPGGEAGVTSLSQFIRLDVASYSCGNPRCHVSPKSRMKYNVYEMAAQGIYEHLFAPDN